jgi:hypothetical protein
MRKKSNRKVRPLVNPIVHAMEGAALIPQARVAESNRIHREAFERLRSGTGSKQDMLSLIIVNNFLAGYKLYYLAPRKLSNPVLDQILNPIEEMFKKMFKRGEETGKYLFNGEGIKLMEQMLEMNHRVLDSTSNGDVDRIISYVRNRIISKSVTKLE